MANEIIREGQEQEIQVQKQNYTVGVFPAGTKTITTNGTHDVTEYASVDAQVAPNLQNKEVTITENGTQTIQADEGYDGIGTISLNTNVEAVFVVPNKVKFGYSKYAGLENFDYSECTDTSQMFYQASNLVSFNNNTTVNGLSRT